MTSHAGHSGAPPWQGSEEHMPDPQPPSGDLPLGPDGLPDLPLRVLEDDENVPPRPEETLADWERTDPKAP